MKKLLALIFTALAPVSYTHLDVYKRQGEVTAVRAVTIQNDSTGVGTATGAVLGGIAGSTVGGGRRANTAGAVAGAAAGGAAGNAIAGSTTAGVEVTVLLENGQSIAVVQAGSPNEFRVGDSVRVSSDGAVSYTHLDVYKRQLGESAAGELRRHGVDTQGCLLYTSRCV